MYCFAEDRGSEKKTCLQHKDVVDGENRNFTKKK